MSCVCHGGVWVLAICHDTLSFALFLYTKPLCLSLWAVCLCRDSASFDSSCPFIVAAWNNAWERREQWAKYIRSTSRSTILDYYVRLLGDTDSLGRAVPAFGLAPDWVWCNTYAIHSKVKAITVWSGGIDHVPTNAWCFWVRPLSRRECNADWLHLA